MPELPDVEQYRRYVEQTCLGQTVEATSVMDDRILEATTPQQLGRRLKGATFDGTRRHGKFLFVKVAERGWLILHFGMTGNLQVAPHDEDPPRFMRAAFFFQNGERLAYLCQRMLGRIGFTESVSDYIATEDLGPDALDSDLDAQGFMDQLENRTAAVKTILINQAVIAGIGNVCSDEILFQAHMHPETPVDELDREEVQGLFTVVREVLTQLVSHIAEGQALPDHYLSAHRDEDGVCPVCETPLEQVSINSRHAYICPNCQSAP